MKRGAGTLLALAALMVCAALLAPRAAAWDAVTVTLEAEVEGVYGTVHIAPADDSPDAPPRQSDAFTARSGRFTLRFDEPGDYVYRVWQEPGDNDHVTYDATEYRVYVSVIFDGAGGLEPRVGLSIRGQAAKPDRVVFKNGAGPLRVELELGPNAPPFRIDGAQEVPAESLLTEAELARYIAGEDVRVWLTVDGLLEQDVPGDELVLHEDMARRLRREIGQYLDICLYKEIGREGPVQISDIGDNNPLRFTFEVVDELRGPWRSFSLVRVHEGQAQRLIDAEKGPELTFSTSKFSTYSLDYRDDEPTPTPAPTPTLTPAPTPTLTPAPTATATPEATPTPAEASEVTPSPAPVPVQSGGQSGGGTPRTGDESAAPLWTALLAVCAAALAGVVIARKKRAG